MPPPFHQFLIAGFSTEILYSFIIIACSLIIYFSTKELYELSSHKGIQYFRLTFLFFAIAYLIRALIKVFLASVNLATLSDISLIIFSGSSLFLFIYFNCMAIFYLLYSFIWKKLKPKRIILFHALALIIAGISLALGFVMQDSLIFLGINLGLFIFVLILFFMAHKKEKKKKRNWLYAIYIMFFIFWVLSILDILVPQFFETFQLIIYMISSGLFLIMLYKVLKKVGAS